MSSKELPIQNLQRSKQCFQEANSHFPGGVNSPVRAFRGVGGDPVFFEKAEGAYLWDVDGNRYIDYVGSWGPAICGHAHPEVVQAVTERAKLGLTFGAPTPLENHLAQAIKRHVPSMEKMRFVSSGTEACMAALRLARGYTQREKIVKFSGCYHGHADMLLVKAGSGALTFGLPDSPGVPQSTTQHTLTATYNSIESVEQIFEQYKGEIAAVILEPIIGNAGFIRPTTSFIQALSQICRTQGALLIFDEVMTGFRVGLRSAQGLFGVTPDLTTLGKVVGGGMPLAVYGGRNDIMEMVAPSGPVYQAGTLSGNPVAVACGLKTIEIIERNGEFDRLSSLTMEFMNGLKALAKKYRISFMTDCEGGMFGYFFSEKAVRNYEEAKQTDALMFQKFFHGMLKRGVYFAPSAYEAGFVSMAHTEDDIRTSLAMAEEVFAEIKA